MYFQTFNFEEIYVLTIRMHNKHNFLGFLLNMGKDSSSLRRRLSRVPQELSYESNY